MRGRLAEVVLGCSGHYIDHSSTDTKLIRLGFVIRTRITCIRARIANDICIGVRITGIRVRIAMRGRLAEVVLGCSGHYIDPIQKLMRSVFVSGQLSSSQVSRARIPIRVRDPIALEMSSSMNCTSSSTTIELDIKFMVPRRE